MARKILLLFFMVLCMSISASACVHRASFTPEDIEKMVQDRLDDIEDAAENGTADDYATSGDDEQYDFDDFFDEEDEPSVSVDIEAEVDEPTSAGTAEQRAVERARSYIGTMPFSYLGLIDQLEYENFTPEQAKYGADHCGADWNVQALREAKSYLSNMPFSYLGLIDQLEYEQYTAEQAKYGADNCGADWNEQALKEAKEYIDSMPFSHSGLVDQLEYDQYTPEQAKYGADNCGADWNEQAARDAADYLEITSFSRQDMIDQLMFEGYTYEQASYGATASGL